MIVNDDHTVLLNDVTCAAGELLLTLQELESIEFEHETLPDILSSAKSVIYNAFMPLMNRRLEDGDPPHTGQTEKIHWAVLGLRAKASLNPSNEFQIVSESVNSHFENLDRQIDEAIENLDKDKREFAGLLADLKAAGKKAADLFEDEVGATD